MLLSKTDEEINLPQGRYYLYWPAFTEVVLKIE